MICAMCGYEFDPDRAAATCANCAMGGSCHMARCPRCGYEMPAETHLSRLAKSLNKWITDRSGRKTDASDTSIR